MAGRSDEIHRELVDSCRAVREYAGSPSSQAVIRMLDALEAAYVIDLRDVMETSLVRVQSALRQTAALRDVLTGSDEVLPKI